MELAIKEQLAVFVRKPSADARLVKKGGVQAEHDINGGCGILLAEPEGSVACVKSISKLGEDMRLREELLDIDWRCNRKREVRSKAHCSDEEHYDWPASFVYPAKVCPERVRRGGSVAISRAASNLTLKCTESAFGFPA